MTSVVVYFVDLIRGILEIPIVITSVTWLLKTWVVVEVLFYFYLRYIVLPELNRLTTPVQATPSAWDQFHRTIDTTDEINDIYPFMNFYSGWFQGCKTSDIYRDNVRELLAWALYGKKPTSISRQELAGINNVLYWLKARFQIDTPEGYNPNAKAMCLTVQDVSYVHRPLLVYAFLTAFQVVGHLVLRMLGFSRHEVNGIAYWYRGRAKDLPRERTRMPLIFFHGISPGLNIYVLMIHLMARDRKAVLIEVPHIAMCLNFKSKRLGDMVKTVEFISKRHRMPHFAVAGHSFGSLCAAWITKHRPKQVRQLILMDPVCVLLALPDVMYNFLYRKPRTLVEHIIYYGGSTEITIHQTLRRQFWWYEGILFLEDIRCPVFFHLSGNDEIVPSNAVRAYINRYCDNHHAEEHDSHMIKHPISEGADLAKRCDAKIEKQGCIKERIRYNYHDGWSHGEILFRPGKLIELDRALSEQEDLFKDWVFEEEEDDHTHSSNPINGTNASAAAPSGKVVA